MNDLAINIEYLLLTHNSVIVPGLGAFTSRVFPARWIEEEELFLPPVRHVRFNADIFQDPDEIFLRSISEIYHLTAEEAILRCEEMVADFHKMLVSEGTIDFASIGLFNLEDDAEITMSPYECGINTPEFYGLDTLHFPLLTSYDAMCEDDKESGNLNMESGNVTITHTAEDTSEHVVEDNAGTVPQNIVLPGTKTYVADSKHIVIRLNRAFVHYTMVTAASIILFFLLGPTVMNHKAAEQVNEATTNMVMRSQTNTKPSQEAKSIQVTPSKKQEVTKTENTNVAQTEELSQEKEFAVETDIKEEQVQKGSEQPSSQVFTELRGSYCIVLASAITQKNAQAFIEKLEQKDVHAIMYDNGKMLRVVVDGFNTQAEAYNINSYLHNLDKDLRATWVMKN